MATATLKLKAPHRFLLDSGWEEAPPSGGGRRSFNEANFDTNMVIILAALLCALICALGLNSIVRCALRCSRRFAFESSDDAVARMAARGLKKSTLRQIPIAVYGSGVSIKATDCPICLGEFQDGEKVRVLPKCCHGFHVRCIDTWLMSHSSCPTCRQSLLEPEPEPEPEPAVEAADGGSLRGNPPAGQPEIVIAGDDVG